MGSYRPMLAELAPAPFDDARYLFEPKWDGARCVAYVSPGEIHLEGRTGSNYTHRFPEITREQVRTDHRLVLDGELICGDGSMASFNLMQRRVHKGDSLGIRWMSKEQPATLMVFDLLELDGEPMLSNQLWVRKMTLDKVLKDSERVMHTPFIETEGRRLFETMRQRGYEGVMAKHRDTPYVPGKRSLFWLKMKVAREAVFLAVGLTQGTGARASTFGALVLATDEGGGLAYRGEVGTGFSNGDLKEILAHAKDAPGYGFGVKGVRWIEPIRCRVKFLDETADGKLRFPAFKGLEHRKTMRMEEFLERR